MFFDLFLTASCQNQIKSNINIRTNTKINIRTNTKIKTNGSGQECPLHTDTNQAKGKGQSDFSDWPLFNAGDYLLSHTLSRAVPSAQRGLT